MIPAPGAREPESGRAPKPRLRLVSAEAHRRPGSQITVAVTLDLDGARVVGEAEGIGTETIEIRLAAEATLSAVEKVLQTSGRLGLVGVKRVHAFDADVVLVAIRSPELRSKQLLGAAALGDREAAHGAAAAVLDAVNRVLGPELLEPEG